MSESIFLKGNPLMRDPIYVKRIRLSCPFCSYHGKPKIIKSPHALQMHFSLNHNNDAYCKKIMEDLLSLLRQGVLR